MNTELCPFNSDPLNKLTLRSNEFHLNLISVIIFVYSSWLLIGLVSHHLFLKYCHCWYFLPVILYGSCFLITSTVNNNSTSSLLICFGIQQCWLGLRLFAAGTPLNISSSQQYGLSMWHVESERLRAPDSRQNCPF